MKLLLVAALSIVGAAVARLVAQDPAPAPVTTTWTTFVVLKCKRHDPDPIGAVGCDHKRLKLGFRSDGLVVWK